MLLHFVNSIGFTWCSLTGSSCCYPVHCHGSSLLSDDPVHSQGSFFFFTPVHSHGVLLSTMRYSLTQSFLSSSCLRSGALSWILCLSCCWYALTAFFVSHNPTHGSSSYRHAANPFFKPHVRLALESSIVLFVLILIATIRCFRLKNRLTPNCPTAGTLPFAFRLRA